MGPYQPNRNKHFSWPWYISLSPKQHGPSGIISQYTVKDAVIFHEMSYSASGYSLSSHTTLYLLFCPSSSSGHLSLLSLFPLRLSCLYPGSTDARWNQYLCIPCRKMYADISPWHLNDTAATVVRLKFPICSVLINTHWTFWLLNSWFCNAAAFFI